MQNKGLTTFVEDYLLWHHFGKKTKEENIDLVHSFKQSIQSVLNPRNLALFINSYLQRTGLQIHRPDKTSSKKVQCLKCPTLLITGATSPHQDDVVNTNSRLDPEISTYFNVSESGGMPLEEQPHKVATSVFLFLQGLGYCKYMMQYLKIGVMLWASHNRCRQSIMSIALLHTASTIICTTRAGIVDQKPFLSAAAGVVQWL